MSHAQYWERLLNKIICYTEDQNERLEDIYKTYRNRRGELTLTQFKLLPAIKIILANKLTTTDKSYKKVCEMWCLDDVRPESWEYHIRMLLMDNPQQVLGEIKFLV